MISYNLKIYFKGYPQRYDVANDAVVLDLSEDVGQSSYSARTSASCSVDKPLSYGYARLKYWTFNSSLNTCETFYFGGGPINTNSNAFNTKQECEYLCVR